MYFTEPVQPVQPVQKAAGFARVSTLLLALSLLAGCSDSNTLQITPPTAPEPAPAPAPEPQALLSAQIIRTEYGIPHVTADDWEDLGYGFGYAYAQDNFCVTMREIVFALGRSAELLGEAQGNPQSDFLFRFLNGDKAAFEQEFVQALPEPARELAEGFAQGMNRYLRDTGVENLPEGDLGCRNAEWVFEFDAVDYLMYLRREALRGSSDQGTFRRALLDVQGPSDSPSPQPSAAQLDAAFRELGVATAPLRDLDRGSNALALGADATQTGAGMLLGNPHQPWFGAGAWYQAHLTIPGVYDVAGAALHGYPFIGIGFNRDVAWTHTVSLANRFTLFELQLNPDNPLQYDFDGEWVDIESSEVSIDVRLADGTLEQRSFTFYTTQYGPVVNLKGVSSLLDGWPIPLTGSIFAFRDANLETGSRSIQQWINKGQASNLEEYVAALSDIGNPVFHDLAADRHGDAFYGEISAIPFVSRAQLDNCIRGIAGPLLFNATGGVIVSLDGSDPACDWGDDPNAPAGSQLYASDQLPQLLTRDYVGNGNDSYWISDASNPLTGFPSVMGAIGGEGEQQSLRTRIGHLMVAERKAASDGLDSAPLFSLENLKGLMYSNRVYGAEVVLDDVLQVCSSDPLVEEIQDVCAVLAAWDRRTDLDSVGAQVFTEFWGRIRANSELRGPFEGVVSSAEFWAVDFDPADPVGTPAGIDLSLDVNHQRVIDALVGARDRLAANNIAIDAPWGEVQYLERGNENVPIHGGSGTMGVYGAIGVSLRDGGYINPTGGNSYIQAVTWDESECPVADVILVPSQSTDPASPHFADQSKLYSDKRWVRFPFCAADVEAARIGEPLVLELFADED